MKALKLAVLLVISFVAIGSVIYQIRNRYKTPARVSTPSSETVAATSSEPAPAAAPPEAPAAPATQVGSPEPSVPANGWGRNPFLTIEEIDRAKEPVTNIAEAAVSQPLVEAPLPAYNVTGVISSNQGNWAIVDARVVQPGDRLGSETVKEIKENGLVLEHRGQIREVPLRRLEDAVRSSAPRKETKE